MDKLLREEIERFKLLSNYDNKKTLDENYKSNEVITEKNGSLLGLFGRQAGTLSKAAIKEIEELFRLIPTEMKKFGNDAAEIAAKLQAKSFTGKELGEFRKVVFMNTQDLVTRKEIADDMVKSKAFKDFFSSVKEKKAIDELMKKGGYSGDDAKYLYDRYKRQGGKFKSDITKNTKTPKSQRMSTTPSERKSYAELALNIINKPFMLADYVIKNFWRILWAAGGIGIAWYLWNHYNDKLKIYPKCLYKNIPKEDWIVMNSKNVDYILISDTGSEFIDENKGGRFFIDNKFETDNGKYKGTWRDDPKLNIVVTLDNGDEHTISCEAVKDYYEIEDDTRDELGSEKETKTVQTEKQKIISSWDGKYKKCDDFPLQLGCINDGVIGTVQICLGLPKDGKFSLKVLDALEKEGYGVELSFDIYKTIQSKCGMSSSESGFASNL